jgi:hypothetical protein
MSIIFVLLLLLLGGLVNAGAGSGPAQVPLAVPPGPSCDPYPQKPRHLHSDDSLVEPAELGAWWDNRDATPPWAMTNWQLNATHTIVQWVRFETSAVIEEHAYLKGSDADAWYADWKAWIAAREAWLAGKSAVEVRAGIECARSQRPLSLRVDGPAPRWPVTLCTMVAANERSEFLSWANRAMASGDPDMVAIRLRIKDQQVTFTVYDRHTLKVLAERSFAKIDGAGQWFIDQSRYNRELEVWMEGRSAEEIEHGLLESSESAMSATADAVASKMIHEG